MFLFASLAMNAVGSTAQDVVVEVRRQFREMPGIMDGSQRPDYARCVDIVSVASLKKMVAPGLLAITLPIAVGVAFRMVGTLTGDPILGAKAVAGFLMICTVVGTPCQH